MNRDFAKSPAGGSGSQASFRCFVAIPVPGEVRSVLASFCEDAKNRFPGYRFVPPENLHITLQFLGEVPRTRGGALREALDASTRDRSPFRVSFMEAGAFPPRGTPRILHLAATGGNEELARLAASVRKELGTLGYGDSKPFAAHITLGREKRESGFSRSLSSTGRSPGTHSDIRSLWEDSYGQFLAKADIRPQWEVTQVILMESVLRPNGPLYIPLGAFPLGEDS
jgi:2'-5' RNA ligase